MVSPVGDRTRIGCFAEQVKLTRILVRDLDEAIKEIKLLVSMERKPARRSRSSRPYARS
jgi:hypothetical protein